MRESNGEPAELPVSDPATGSGPPSATSLPPFRFMHWLGERLNRFYHFFGVLALIALLGLGITLGYRTADSSPTGGLRTLDVMSAQAEEAESSKQAVAAKASADHAQSVQKEVETQATAWVKKASPALKAATGTTVVATEQTAAQNTQNAIQVQTAAKEKHSADKAAWRRKLLAKTVPPDAEEQLWTAMGIGAIAVAIVWIVLWIFTTVRTGINSFLLAAVVGEDGAVSTSKFQALMWMLAVVFAYFALLAMRLHFELWDDVPGLKPSLVTALGLGTGVAAASKWITIRSQATGRRIKRKNRFKDPKAPRTFLDTWGDLIRDDYGRVEVSKIFMLFWTMVAVMVFEITLYEHVRQATHMTFATLQDLKANMNLFQVPDIDGGLTALVGLGQLTYLGMKLSPPDAIRLVGIAPAVARAGEWVRLTTTSLPQVLVETITDPDCDDAFAQVMLDDVPVRSKFEGGSTFGFQVPIATAPAAGSTTPATGPGLAVHKIALVLEGTKSDPISMTIDTSMWPASGPATDTALNLVRVSPARVSAGGRVTLHTSALPRDVDAMIQPDGAGLVVIQINGVPAQILSVSRNAFDVQLPLDPSLKSGLVQAPVSMAVMGKAVANTLSLGIVSP